MGTSNCAGLLDEGREKAVSGFHVEGAVDSSAINSTNAPPPASIRHPQVWAA